MSVDSEEWIISIHEAGHAVVAATLGMEVKQVVLHRPGSRQDQAGRCELYNWSAERDHERLRFLTFMLAGAAAEYRAAGRTSSRDGADREAAAELASLTLEKPPDSPQVTQLVTAAEAIAKMRMENPMIWTWTQRVATALRKRRRLTGRAVCELRPVTP